MLALKSAESQIAMECKNVLILSVIQRWMAINNLDYLIKANTLNYRSDLQERLQLVKYFKSHDLKSELMNFQ